MLRICKICTKEKDIALFESNKTCRYGRGYRCRKCIYQLKKTIIYRWFGKNKERVNLIHKKNQQKYYLQDKTRQLARGAAQRYKDSIKKENCENCGLAGKLHMYHPDYAKPLDVVTLCIPCHAEVHSA